MGRGRGFYVWTPRRVLKLRSYARRGFSMREAAKLMDMTYGAIINAASARKISFHGPSGAPLMNRNHKLGEHRKLLRGMVAGD